MKKCTNPKCMHKGKLQPLSNFHKDSNNKKDKLNSRCKTCRSLYYPKKQNLNVNYLRNQKLKQTKKRVFNLIDIFFTSIKLGRNPNKAGEEIITIIKNLCNY